MSKKIICLDPGHGPETVNASPDGTYREVEFAWDMYERMKSLLEAQGFAVICTRSKEEKPSLSERSAVCNRAGADLFLSLHTNAIGSGSWNSARGLLVFTSSASANASRNRAAMAMIERFRGAKVHVRNSGLAHQAFTVLAKTDAPACLLEYGFHTNKEDVALLKTTEYRETLAKATVLGVCDYFGMAFAEKKDSDAPALWAESAWESAKTKGLVDGTRPRDAVSRQELVVILQRLGLF